jgi:peptide/nickel transport system substrate-binding protein
VLRYAIGFDPVSLSPLLATSMWELDTERLIFDPLVTPDDTGKLVPILATRVPTVQNGDVSRDGRTITYHLRRGVRWQDGAPFTSADVKFTAQAIVNPKNIVTLREGFDQIAAIDTPDPSTVVFHFKRTYPPAVATIFSDGAWAYGILPKHLLAGLDSLNRAAFFTAHPVGTGPFALASWKRGDRIELVRNPDYFLGRPKLHRITIFLVPDASTRLLMFQSHQIDWYPLIPPQLISVAARTAGSRTVLVNQNRFVSLTFNTRRAPFDNRTFRRAIASALDRPRLANVLTYGTAIPAVADIAPVVWAYPKGLRALRHDPAAARTAFQKTPWHVRPIQLLFPNTAEFSSLALEVQAQLHAAGLSVALRPYPRALYFGPSAAGGLLQRGDFDIALVTWASGADPDDSFFYLCSLAPPQGQNYGSYCSSAMDSAQHVALGTVDLDVRRRAYQRIERLAVEDVPQVFIWWPREPHVLGANFKDFRPNLVVDTWNAQEWDS